MCFETMQRGATCPPAPRRIFAVEDPTRPGRLHVLQGTPEGIAALEVTLQEEYERGRAAGLASAQDRLDQVEGALRALLRRMEVKR